MFNIFLIILVSGLFFSALPGGINIFVNEPSWFKNVIYLTSAYLLFTTMIFGFVCFLIDINKKSKPTQFLVICISMGFVVIPDIYLNSAFFLGRGGARFETWPLVSLCTAFYQIVSSVLFGLTAFIAVKLYTRNND